MIQLALTHMILKPYPPTIMLLAILLAVLPVLASNAPREPPTSAPKPAVVTLVEYSYDTRLLASVVTAQPSATTYSLGCPASEGTTCFGYGNGIPTVTVIAGPSTAAQTLSIEELDLTIQINCQLTATSPFGGPCVKKVRSGSLSDTTSFDAVGTMWATFVGITVTGGLEKLTGGGTATSTEAPSATSVGSSLSHHVGSSITSAAGGSAATTVTTTGSTTGAGASTGTPTTTTRGNSGSKSSVVDWIPLIGALLMAV